MTIQVEERYAYMASGIASATPILIDRFGLDDMLVDVTNRVFEGDAQAARRVVGGTFGLIALILAYLTYSGGVDGMLGVSLAAVAVALGTIAVMAFTGL